MSIINKCLTIFLVLSASILFDSHAQSDNDQDFRFNLSNNTVFTPGNDVAINLFSNYGQENSFHFKLFKIVDYEKFIALANRKYEGTNFDIWGKNRQGLLRFTKLIKEWDDLINTSGTDWNSHNVNTGKIDEPGNYILQATKDSNVAYCGIAVSNLTIIQKDGRKQILAMVADAKTGKVVSDINFKIFSNDKLINSSETDKSGLILFSLNDSVSVNSDILLMATTPDEVIFNNPYFYSGSGVDNYIGYTYTNQPVYRPGQHVYFKSIFRDRRNGALENIPDEKFQVKINSPKGREIYSDTLITNEFGTLSGDLVIENDAELGQYSIHITNSSRYYFGSFDVEEYKKPEYIVKISPGKKDYTSNDTIKALISADYYFGSPVITGKVNIKLFRQNIWHPWWYWSEYSWFYKDFPGERFNSYGSKEQITQEYGELDKNGHFNFTYIVDPKLKEDFVYIITAEVIDNSRNSVSGSEEVHVTRGSFTISTSPGQNFAVSGGPVNIRVNAFNFSDMPVKTKFIAAFNYPEQRNNNGSYFRPISDTLTGSTDSSGKANISFLPKGFFQGNYRYTIIAYDEKGRKITAEANFYIGNYESFKNNGNIEIITNKEAYELGDTLTAFISLPQKNTDLLLTFEKNSFLGYEIHHVEGNNLSISLKLSDQYSPSFNIAVTFIKEGQLFTFSKMVGVLNRNKFLNISLRASGSNLHEKMIYHKPGEEVNYKITVKDNGGNPVKNTELSFGIIDESIYAIKEDPAQDIKPFFYSPEHFYIPTSDSHQNYSYYGVSRRITLIDKVFDNRNISPNGDGLLSGKLITKYNHGTFSNIYVLLSSDSCFYETKADISGKYILKKIKKGDYDLFILLDYGITINVGKIDIGDNSNKDINLGDYTNVDQQPIAFNNRGNINNFGQAVVVTAQAQGVLQSEVKRSKAFVQPELRSNFVDAVIWKAHAVTDENGEADVKFKMPDNLTTWRATVKGITQDSKVGQNTDKTITRKNLLVRLETPRFFREGDEVSVSTIVHNYLSESKKVKINFMPGNFEVLGSKITAGGGKQAGLLGPLNNGTKRSYEVNIDKDSEARIDWIVKVIEPIGKAVIKAEALTNEESDAVELTVPVEPRGIKKAEPLNAENSGEGVTNLVFNIPKMVNIKTAKLSFSATPSLAGTILKALDDLTGYPYGCVEQTMSKFLPTIIVANTFKEINAPLSSNTIKELPKMVDAGLKRLYSFQHPDGGWGWWTNDETNPYMTAYVIFGMSLAKEAGYNIDTNSFNNGLNNLAEQIKNFGKIDFTTRAFMLYSFSTALKHNNSYKDSIYLQKAVSLKKEQLNPYALSLLAITFNNFKDNDDLKETLLRLSKSVIDESNTAYWGGKAWHYSWQDDKVQSTAFAVKALMLDKTYSPLVSKGVRWLIQHKQGFSWRSTQETSTVIFALTDYLKTTNELNPDFTATVYVNNNKEFEKNFTKDDVFENNPSISLDGLNADILKPGINKIKIVKSGEGKLYFSGLNTYYSQEKEKYANKEKFIVTRDYYLLNPVDEGNKIVYEKEKFKGKIKSGQILYVQTRVETEENDLQYFILEDMLPSGFEPIKNERNFEIKEEEEQPANRVGFWQYADKEYHDDRVSFFITNVQSSMEFSYLIQAQIPGKFNVNPAQGYLMYYPEFTGSSNAQEINTKE